MIVVVMGVSGAGKTTVGEALAQHLGWEFLDADDFHPADNVAKMAAGTALTDADRAPWLDHLNAQLVERADAGRNAVLACSALKQAYRTRLLRNVRSAVLAFLHAEFEHIQARVATRKHKYMPASLLVSQFDALEPPREAVRVDATLSVAEAVSMIVAGLPTQGPAHTP